MHFSVQMIPNEDNYKTGLGNVTKMHFSYVEINWDTNRFNRKESFETACPNHAVRY